MEFHSRGNVQDLFQKVRDFRKINGEGLNDCDDSSLDDPSLIR